MAICGMGGDERHLAAIVQEAADLADLVALGQSDLLLGQSDLCRGDPRRPMKWHRAFREVLDWPVLALEVLVPGDDRDAAARQTVEQVRAPALAVEDQGDRRLAAAKKVAGIPGDDPQGLQLRHHVMLQGPHHLAVEILVETYQRGARKSVDPIACRGRKAELLALDEVLRHLALAVVDLDMAVHRQRHPVLRAVLEP